MMSSANCLEKLAHQKFDPTRLNSEMFIINFYSINDTQLMSAECNWGNLANDRIN